MTSLLLANQTEFNTVKVGQNFSAVIGSFDSSFADYLHQLDAIEYVEPNQKYKAAHVLDKRSMQTDPAVKSWGLSRISQRNLGDLRASAYDDSIEGDGVHVYIFDTGINAHHPDFEGRVVSEGNFVDTEPDKDTSGHGTHVAGTVGGATFGVAKKVQLHSVKVLDHQGDGDTVALIKALSHVSKVAPPGKSIINLSLVGPHSQAIDDAIATAANDHNIPVFVAAGNSADDACLYTPSSNPFVMTVGATTKNDEIASFSSYGSCVQLYAPGEDIISAWNDGDSHSMRGTSMANPHVSGIAALLLSQRSYVSVNDLYADMQAMATKDMIKVPDTKMNLPNNNLLAFTGFSSH
ncbi:peptidase S8/S53 domain-containing protein [Syncephalastrum racemosum]|uniref:Peptidase S8/S53 domain-containing protein n=1 Tax=Syncephalastrum racemosum TaxID=13706 RepID=A0A1X2HGE3_SYNRA|nr:peptidase S8/S53 domain-containing protein [Syncephalastrum racemosum]